MGNHRDSLVIYHTYKYRFSYAWLMLFMFFCVYLKALRFDECGKDIRAAVITVLGSLHCHSITKLVVFSRPENRDLTEISIQSMNGHSRDLVTLGIIGAGKDPQNNTRQLKGFMHVGDDNQHPSGRVAIKGSVHC